MREYPLSVYALLALARLKIVGRATPRRRWSPSLRKGLHEVPAWSFPPRALYGEPGFLRAVELARMGQGGDARRELARLGLATSADKHAPAAVAAAARAEGEDLLWITATLLDRGGVWSASHSLPRYGVTSLPARVSAGARRRQVEARLPARLPGAGRQEHARPTSSPRRCELAIMREESAFSPKTESFANAIGLTQMLVKTAKRFSDGAPVTRDVLLDPAKNVELGARFLGFLWKHFDGTAPLTIAGYNAGEAAVDRWLGDRGDLDMDEFMETIPYDETRNYTKRVLASYFAYSWLYGAEAGPARSRCARAPRPSTAAATTPSTPAPKPRTRPRARKRARSSSRALRLVRPRPATRREVEDSTSRGLLLLLAAEEAALLGADALAAGRRVGAQVRRPPRR